MNKLIFAKTKTPLSPGKRSPQINLFSQVQPFLQLQPPVSQEQFQEATQVGSTGLAEAE